jgi:hypothetical protein
MHSDFSFVLEGWVGTSRLLSVEKLQRAEMPHTSGKQRYGFVPCILDMLLCFGY